MCAENPDRFCIIGHRFRISPLLGRADQLADATINALDDFLLGVPKQPAGVDDLLNLLRCLRSNVTELDLPNFAAAGAIACSTIDSLEPTDSGITLEVAHKPYAEVWKSSVNAMSTNLAIVEMDKRAGVIKSEAPLEWRRGVKWLASSSAQPGSLNEKRGINCGC